MLWKNVDRITRQNIGTAQRDGVSVREGAEFLEPAYDLIRETFARSEMAFMDRDAFERFAHGLGQHGKVLMAEYRGAPQSYCLFGFSVPSAYAIYAGNLQGQHQGANKLLYWEAIRRFRALGTRTLDFAGARDRAGERFKAGRDQCTQAAARSNSLGRLHVEVPLRPWRASAYSTSVRLLRGGDIVDQERHKLQDYRPNRTD